MPRKPKETSPSNPPFGEEEAVLTFEIVPCSEDSCTGNLTNLDADGFGICDQGHTGQPVPTGTWKPAPPVQMHPDRHDFVEGEAVAEIPSEDPCGLCSEPRRLHTTQADRDFQAEYRLGFCNCGHIGQSHPEGRACRIMVNDDPCDCLEFEHDADEEGQSPLIDMPAEMHQGRAVLGREVSLGGSASLSMHRVVAREFWETLRIGMVGKVEVTYEVAGDGFKPVKTEGQIIGLTDTRKLKLISYVLPESKDPTEGLPLWKVDHDRQMRESELLRELVSTNLGDIRPTAEDIERAGPEIAEQLNAFWAIFDRAVEAVYAPEAEGAEPEPASELEQSLAEAMA